MFEHDTDGVKFSPLVHESFDLLVELTGRPKAKATLISQVTLQRRTMIFVRLFDSPKPIWSAGLPAGRVPVNANGKPLDSKIFKGATKHERTRQSQIYKIR